MSKEQFAKDYPNLAKASAISDKSQMIGGFLEWMREEKGIELVKYDADNRYVEKSYSIHDLLFDYFEIDRKAYDKEQLALLQQHRAA